MSTKDKKHTRFLSQPVIGSGAPIEQPSTDKSSLSTISEDQQQAGTRLSSIELKTTSQRNTRAGTTVDARASQEFDSNAPGFHF